MLTLVIYSEFSIVTEWKMLRILYCTGEPCVEMDVHGQGQRF